MSVSHFVSHQNDCDEICVKIGCFLYSPIFWSSPLLPVYSVRQPFHREAYLRTSAPTAR